MFKEGETVDDYSVDDYSMRLNGMVATLARLGEVVEKILHNVPSWFKQIVLVIQTLLNVSTLTVAKVTGSLTVAEEAFEAPPLVVNHDDKLYLTQEKWDVRRKQRKAENQNSSSASGSSTRRGNRRGRGRVGDLGSSSSSGSGGAPSMPSKDQYRCCDKYGHWARECKSKPKKEEVHVAQEEEASMLLLRAHVTMGTRSPSPTPPPPIRSPSLEEPLPHRGSTLPR